MKIFRLAKPHDSDYARAFFRGSWSDGELCSECEGSTESRIEPLILGWVPGSGEVPDFLWPGFQEIVLAEPATDRLASIKGYSFGPVQFLDHPNLDSLVIPPRYLELWVTPVEHSSSLVR